MRAAPLLLALALAACGGAASSTPVANTPAASSSSVTLQYTSPKVGATWSEEQTQTMELAITIGDAHMKMTGHKVERKSIEVLEVADGAVTKARYTYTAIEESQDMDGKHEAKESPIAGKSYTLAVGSPTVVTTDTGPVSDEEAAAVRHAEKNFGKQDQMSKMLAGKTFTLDEPVELPSDLVKEAMDDDGSMSDAKMTLTFRGMEGDDARFDVSMTMSGHEGGSDIAVDMTGSALIDPNDGQMDTMELTGPFRMSGHFQADGPMTISARRTQ